MMLGTMLLYGVYKVVVVEVAVAVSSVVREKATWPGLTPRTMKDYWIRTSVAPYGT